MANECIGNVGTTGLSTVRAHAVNRAGQRWNGSAYENYLFANIATYDITATEIGATGTYTATIPSGAVSSCIGMAFRDTAVGQDVLAFDDTPLFEDVQTLLSRVTSARAGYLDNLNVGGPVSTQADVFAIDESASRRILFTSASIFERPESGSTTYTLELRTLDEDGNRANASSTPIISATGQTSGVGLSANLGAVSNPGAGVYRCTYTVTSAATLEPVRFDATAVMSDSTQTMTYHTQIADYVAATFTTADRTKIDAIHAKLPTNNLADQTLLAADLVTVNSNVLTRSTLTQAQVTGGLYPLSSASAVLGDPAIAAIKAKTDTIPASPAAVGSAMTLADASIKDATFDTSAIESGLPTSSTLVRGLAWLLRRFGVGGNSIPATKSTSAIVTKKADGTPWTTQAITSDGAGNESLGRVA